MKNFYFIILFFIFFSCENRDCTKLYTEQYSGFHLSDGGYCFWTEDDGCGRWYVFQKNDSSLLNKQKKYLEKDYTIWSQNTYGIWFSKHVWGYNSGKPEGTLTIEPITFTVFEDCNWHVISAQQ